MDNKDCTNSNFRKKKCLLIVRSSYVVWLTVYPAHNDAL